MSEVEEKQINEKTEKAKKAKNRTSLKNIIGGDILATDFFRRQTKLLVLIMVLILFYIHNRYACQQQMIEIDKLKKELIDIKYDALTRSSELMEKSRHHPSMRMQRSSTTLPCGKVQSFGITLDRQSFSAQDHSMSKLLRIF